LNWRRKLWRNKSSTRRRRDQRVSKAEKTTDTQENELAARLDGKKTTAANQEDIRDRPCSIHKDNSLEANEAEIDVIKKAIIAQKALFRATLPSKKSLYDIWKISNALKNYF
jgi:hypothetical protein